MSNRANDPVMVPTGNQPRASGFGGPPVRLAEKTWLTEDQLEAVPDGDERARFLLGLAGDEIPAEQAELLGLDAPRKQRRAHNDKQRLPAADK